MSYPLRSFLSAVLLLTLSLLTGSDVFAAGLPTIKRLKALHLTTSLVDRGAAQAVIVAPGGGRYRAEVAQLNERIRTLTGTTLPVFADDKLPEEILRDSNVITLGNMASNAFIEKLYFQWQVILDLKYPGEGGFVVRSLHNPYASGHNVIFLGGSDDAGVSAAVTAFSDGLKGDATLQVGRLAQIRLGKGVTLPRISAEMKKWDVQSWNDSRRTTSGGRETGYPSATFFGWNPISIAGVLYYMTGESKYLDLFKELALPIPDHIPAVNSADDAFNDPSNPLVKNYHYRSHLVDCVYDLIEESPGFTDEERLRITNKLVEHQFELDPEGTYSKPLGDRHATWHMLCIYSGSRYFSRYYPDPLWERRLTNVRKAFASFNIDPTWGSQGDTLNFVATYIEPLFEFALLDGPTTFVDSGAARTFMQGLETLMTGDEVDDYNFFLPHNLLFKAAWLLKDSRYIWMANQLGLDFSKFRIGQSYWPAVEAPVMPLKEMSGSITIAPLSKIDRETTKTPVPLNEAFQVLSYRTGLEKNDDFLLLDGFAGTGRHPFQLNTLLRLRMFNGKNILAGYANDLSVWPSGMSEPQVARSAALKGKVTTKTFAFIHTEVPDMPGSRWQRRIVYLKDRHAVVVDRVSARESGRFDVLSSWEVGGGVELEGKASSRIEVLNGAVLASADLPYEKLSKTIVRGMVSRELHRDEPIILANLFFNNTDNKTISPLKQGGYLVSGGQPGFIGVGPASYSNFSVQADFSYLDSRHLLLEGGTELVVKGLKFFSSDTPVTLFWDLKEQSVHFSAPLTARVRLAGADGLGKETIINGGEQSILPAIPPAKLIEQLRHGLMGLDREIQRNVPAIESITATSTTWHPVWEHALKGKITFLIKDDNRELGRIWAVSQDAQTSTITSIDLNGRLKQIVRKPGEILSILPAVGEKQSQAFAILAGFKDDMLRAYSENGNEVWAVKTSIHPSFLIGDHYEAPWFTNPEPPNNMTGVYSLLADDFWNTGIEEIAVGRPSTVEFRSLDGQLLGSVPTRWGNNTSLALLKSGATGGSEPTLLAGKAYTGNPTLSGINGQYINVSDGLYNRMLPGFTNMHSWLMRGLAGLRVADINGDGSEEVIYTLSGHWNELRVYNAAGTPLWMKYFGPDKNTGAPFMTALELADLDGDGRKEVLIATRHGWLIAFDHLGTQIWQRHFESGISRVSISEQNQKIAVGCDDGSLALLDNVGKQLAVGQMSGAVRSVVFDEDAVIAGSANGLVRRYAIPN